MLLALQHEPFKPLDTVGLRWLSLKDHVLACNKSAKIIGELHAFSVHDKCFHFLLGGAGVLVCLNPVFNLKLWSKSYTSQSIELQPLHSPQDGDAQSSRMVLLCQVRALTVYIQWTEA